MIRTSLPARVRLPLRFFRIARTPDLIFVPIGGGGLISGIATVVKALRPQATVIGVQAAACPSAYQALKEGKVCRVEAERSIADGIAVKTDRRASFCDHSGKGG